VLNLTISTSGFCGVFVLMEGKIELGIPANSLLVIVWMINLMIP